MPRTRNASARTETRTSESADTLTVAHPESWFASSADVASTDTTALTVADSTQVPVPEPAPASTHPPILTDKHGYARCRPEVSAPRTRNGFVPEKRNYAAQARAHILTLLRTKQGRATVADVNALTDALITSNSVPSDYVHRPHVLYWRKQVLTALESDDILTTAD